MPGEARAKLELREELTADVEARRLEHLAPPCDGVRGGHPVMGSGVRDTQPRSGLGRGSSKTPLAASALEAWRRDQPARGLRPMAQAATTRGWVSRVAKEAAAPRPRGHFARPAPRTCCPARYGPGVCPTIHGWPKVQSAVRLQEALWRWVAGRWIRYDREGQLVARFRTRRGENAEHEYLFLTRRKGAPHATVWTRVTAERPSAATPCELQLALENGCLVHKGGAGL